MAPLVLQVEPWSALTATCPVSLRAKRRPRRPRARLTQSEPASDAIAANVAPWSAEEYTVPVAVSARSAPKGPIVNPATSEAEIAPTGVQKLRDPTEPR